MSNSNIKTSDQKLPETAVAQMFDKIAPRYDFLNRLLSAGNDQRWRSFVSKRIPTNSTASLLDVATGTGDLLIKIADTHPQMSSFVGVDISENMLSLAQKKTQQHKLNSKIQFKKMSAEHLEFVNHTFDYLSIAFGLRNVANPKQAIYEFSRCLKPNGKLFILEFFPEGRSSSAYKFVSSSINYILPKIGGLFSDPEAYCYLPKSVNRFYSLDELKSVCKAHGLDLSSQKSFIFGYCRFVEFTKT